MHYIGIIGFGGVANWHYETSKKLSDILVVKGVYDINPEKIKNAVNLGLYGYNSLDEILYDKELDVIYLCVPNNFHKEISIKALKAGKHVLCEKPVTLCPEDFDEICKVAKDCNKIFTVHQNRRWDKDFRVVKKVLENKTIGKPFYIESRVQGSNGVPGDWRLTKVAGGGMVYDWGVHLLDQLLWMIDSPVTEIYAHLLYIKSPEVDDNFKVLLKFKNGISALVEVDTYCFSPLPRWHVSGDEGTMVVDNWNCDGKILKAKLVEMKYEAGIVYTGSGPTKTMAPRPVETIEELPLPTDIDFDNLNLFRNFMDVIDGKAERIIKLPEIKRVLKVIEAIFESADKGIAVKCEM